MVESMDSLLPDYSYERTLASEFACIAGVDEVGRGPLAGPVVAAAVVLDGARLPVGVTDSKKLSLTRREALFNEIMAHHAVGIGEASVEEIDRLNIRRAALLAMQRAVAALPETPDHVLVDGRDVPENLPCNGKAIIKGDARIMSIGAASIIAKVTRDRMMRLLAAEHPAFGWEKNAGYGTAVHMAALTEMGPTIHHRRSFAPVRAFFMEESA